jgi:hypothetical protein
MSNTLLDTKVIDTFATTATQMAEQYAVFANAAEVATALKAMNDGRLDLEGRVAQGKKELGQLQKRTREWERRHKKAAALTAELEAKAADDIANREEALAAILRGHMPDVLEAARAQAYAQAIAEAFYEEAMVAHEEQMQETEKEGRALQGRIEQLRQELRDMVGRATGAVDVSVQ